MKSKLSMKILGIGVVFAMLASLLVGLTAAPVSAATNQMVFTPLSLPSNIGNFLGGVSYTSPTNLFAGAATYTGTPQVITEPHLNSVAASADGNTIYAFDATNMALYESTNGGKSWGTTVGININYGGPSTFVGMEMSPQFAKDGTVILVTTKQSGPSIPALAT